MKINADNRHLVRMMGEVTEMKNNGSIQYFANQSKYDEFISKNTTRADSVIERVAAIEKACLIFDETGQPKRDENKVLLTQEGKTIEDLQKESDEIWNFVLEITLW